MYFDRLWREAAVTAEMRDKALTSEKHTRLWEKHARLSEVNYPRYDLMLEYWNEEEG